MNDQESEDAGSLSFPNRPPKKDDSQAARGVILLWGLPRGMEEMSLKRLLRQFGSVTRMKLQRSKKTGGSRGFAFVEFEFKEVAEIVAKTLTGFIMFGKTLKAQMVPRQKLTPGVFWGDKHKTPEERKVLNAERHSRHGGEKTARSMVRYAERELRRRAKLKEMGLDVVVEGCLSGPVSETTLEQIRTLEAKASEERRAARKTAATAKRKEKLRRLKAAASEKRIATQL